MEILVNEAALTGQHELLKHFTEVSRLHGNCLLHNSAPIWIVAYPAHGSVAAVWHAFKAKKAVPKGRDPWTIDNQYVGGKVEIIGRLGAKGMAWYPR